MSYKDKDYDGYIESFDETGLTGWAYNIKCPDTPVEVEIYDLSTQTRLTVAAVLYRGDLKEAGFGNGCHGFKCSFPAIMADNEHHTISVKISNTDFFLYNSPFEIYIPAMYEGYIDGFDNSGFTGWAYDKKTPDTPVDVEIYDVTTQTHLTTITADTYRKDLEEAGVGNGCHAFRYDYPATITDNHTISVKISNTDFLLDNSPFTVCLLADYPPVSLLS
ncbi:hypothetical protein [Candidatus Magnetomonas plexicatena]|uniref:hypothetical protein n=1 Tax=Candidatus Magnetomonas plexicatena TaxID=2552947 RepID=UPI001C74898C|nr:hypothetical protein E2O03_012550 [Nitrospirales bacterium LBB_01]